MAKKVREKTSKKKVWVATKRWLGLTREAQVEEVRGAMERGCSNKTAATELGATPGMVAGLRRDHTIPSKNKPGGQPGALSKKRVVELAVSEATQCHYKDEHRYRCGGLREPDSLFCFQHPPKRAVQKNK